MSANQTAFPYLRVEGTPYEVGFAHGAKGKDSIRTSIECYRGMFWDYSGIDWETAKKYALTFIPAIEHYDPDIMEEIRGIAAGSGFALSEILALNVQSEIVLQGSQVCAKLDGGCTSPVCAHAELRGDTIFLRALYYDSATGAHRVGTDEGSADEPETLGVRLARRLRG